MSHRPGTHILVREHARSTQYLCDTTDNGMAITTTDPAKAIAFSMRGAVAIARELDRDAGKFHWKAIPKPK